MEVVCVYDILVSLLLRYIYVFCIREYLTLYIGI